MDYFPLPSGTLASPVPSEYFDFLPGHFYASPVTVRCDFSIPSVFLHVCMYIVAEHLSEFKRPSPASAYMATILPVNQQD